MVIIRKRGEERSSVIMGSEVDNGKKPKETGRNRCPKAVWILQRIWAEIAYCAPLWGLL